MEIIRLAGLIPALVLTACHGTDQPNTSVKNDVPAEWVFDFFIIYEVLGWSVPWQAVSTSAGIRPARRVISIFYSRPYRKLYAASARPAG